ncbi:hypothetical protein [Mangrovimonas sp. DI 80]|uniref:hypothetical protein n=1 Tax=Mangrovimonas sp. DI 80 TaxID=1779330 RepID=UPI00097677B5|nr:hypothetical protein [Mangrovimonas sp. DI 80]
MDTVLRFGMMKNIWFLSMLLLSVPVFAQETEETIEAEVEMEFEEEEVFHRNKLAFYAGYSWIPEGRDIDTGEKEVIIAPTFGFSYEYWLTERWAIGTYNDVEIVNLHVENSKGDFLERENATVLSVAGTWEALPRWTVSLGGGIETDAHETLWIVRLGSEFILLEKNNWELSVGFNYIYKDVYDIFGLGFVYGLKF